MKNKAFTLIEVLIAVIIIGILAAIAVPKYQIAVAKTRFASLKDVTNKIVEAQEYHHLLKGSYARKFEDLDIQLPSNKLNTSTSTYYRYTWGACQLYVSDARVVCMSSSMGYIRYYSLATSYPSRRSCIYYGTNITSPQAKVCQQETKHTRADAGTISERIWHY